MNILRVNACALFSVFFFISSGVLNAQQEGKVRLGIKASPMVTWMTAGNQGFENDGLRFGGKYGLFGDFTIFGDQRYNFKTGLMIANLGGKFVYPEVYEAEDDNGNPLILTSEARAKYNLTYLTVPAQIKLRTEEIGFSYYYAVFGAEFGYNLGATVTETFRDETREDIDIEQHRFDEVKKFRTELVIGGGMERIISGQTRLVVGISYHRGLNNVLEGRDYLIDDDDRVVVNDGEPQLDRDLKTALHYVTLNIGVSF